MLTVLYLFFNRIHHEETMIESWKKEMETLEGDEGVQEEMMECHRKQKIVKDEISRCVHQLHQTSNKKYPINEELNSQLSLSFCSLALSSLDLFSWIIFSLIDLFSFQPVAFVCFHSLLFTSLFLFSSFLFSCLSCCIYF